jgi:hypothetical protein
MEEDSNTKLFQDLLLGFLKNNVLDIIFNRNGFSAKIINQEVFEEKLKDDNTKKEFANFMFDVFSGIKDFVTNNSSINDQSENFFQRILEIIPGIREYILVKSSSNLNLLNESDWEIMTKRDSKTPENIIAYSILLNLDINPPSSDEDKSNIFSVELTQNEAIQLVNKLNDALKQLKKIE